MTFSEQLLLLIFMFIFFLPLLNASEAKRCSSSTCGYRFIDIDIRFPFWLFPKQPSTCGHTGFNLLCTDRHETALKLPNSELFLVRDIDYKQQMIRLYDPNDCMAKRLLSFDASGSPFSPLHLLNYTILTCPNKEKKPSSRYKRIPCLGNSTSSFFATRFDRVSSMPSSCQIVKTLLLPVYTPYSVGLNDDLWLKWDSPDCSDCDSSICGFKNTTTLEIKCYSSFMSGLSNIIFLIVKLIICLWLLITLFGTITYVVYDIRQSVARRELPRDLTRSAISGLYKKVKVEENMKLPAGNDNICPICLSEYVSSETVGCLTRCEHCFHVECIDAWLQLGSSCPICRNSLSQGEVCD